MNADTQRQVDTILKRGWFALHQTFGEGRWGVVNGATIEWRKYRILLPEDFAEDIYARDDCAAIAGFHELYLLKDGTPYLIQEVITTYRTIEES